jgi:hypothetical protein
MLGLCHLCSVAKQPKTTKPVGINSMVFLCVIGLTKAPEPRETETRFARIVLTVANLMEWCAECEPPISAGMAVCEVQTGLVTDGYAADREKSTRPREFIAHLHCSPCGKR